MNWGGFASGLSQGFNNGLKLGESINDLMREDRVQKVREQGIAEATAARDAATVSSVRDNGISTPSTQATAPTETAITTPVEQPPSAVESQRATALPPVDASLAGAPAQTPTEPEVTGTPQATPATPAPSAPQPAAQATPPTAAGIPVAKKRYSVGDASFDTMDEAVGHARKNQPSIMDFMHNTLVPKMEEVLLAQGDIKKASDWTKWAKDKQSERHMQNWANAKMAADRGDFEAAAQHLGKLHKDYDDGTTVIGQEPVKDKDGKLTGFNLKIKNDTTGETRAQFIDPQTLVNMGLEGLSPPKMFELAYQKQTAAETLKAKAAIDAQNDARTYKRDIDKQGMIEDRADKRSIASDKRAADKDDRQHGYKLEELTTAEDLKQSGIGKAEKAKVQAKIDVLKDAGLPAETIRELIPHMVGGDGYKKSTSPEEARRLLMTERIKDPMFNHKTPAEQKKIIDQDMVTIGGVAAKPAAAAPPAAPGAKKGTPYLTPDGSIVYR